MAMKHICGTCNYMHPVKQGTETAYICKHNPPTPVIAVVNNALRGQVYTVQAIRPPVSTDDTCGLWEPNHAGSPEPAPLLAS